MLIDILTKVLEVTLENSDAILLSSVLFAFFLYLSFKKKKYGFALLALLFGLFAFLFFGGILDWLEGLGGDSFLETQSFNVREAWFWFSTFLALLPQMLVPFNKAFALMLAEVFMLSMLCFLAMKKWAKLGRCLFWVLLAGGFYFVYSGYRGFEAGREYSASLNRQFSVAPQGFSASADVDLFMYLGESTTTMNMSLYGYPLRTTPELDALYRQDPGFLRFDRIRSTHTHTSLSLLRALAVVSPKPDGTLIRWGLGDVLVHAGLRPRLYSVQPLNGSFASFSRFVFSGLNINIPQDERYYGNYAEPKVKDHELLDKALSASGVVFFHSYAGHGDYLEHIDETRSRAVERPKIAFDGWYGNKYPAVLYSGVGASVEAYDRAITYIDRNVAHAIQQVRLRKKPAVLIYFSDHGESVYTKRAHDSSRFINEMSTVPMVVYFNEAYQTAYPEVFARYKQASLSQQEKLLSQISTTVLEILNVHSTPKLDEPSLASSVKHPRSYILTRDTLKGSSRIDLEYDPQLGVSKSKFFGGNPESTYISMITDKFGEENKICYHRSNSFAKLLRAAQVANCVEFDLVVDGKELQVFHPPAKPTGLSLEHVFSIAQARKTSLWIDSKNLEKPEACNTLASYLEKNHSRVGQIFVEFPWASSMHLQGLSACGQKMLALGVRTSYYVPTHFLLPCAEDPDTHADACKSAGENVLRAMRSGMFTDLSFDYAGLPAMQRMQGADRFKWNTWAIKPKEFHLLPRQKFDFIIMDTSTDPNTY